MFFYEVKQDWEEIPIIDIVPDTPGYGDNCERNLREMIRQHYNHPSIITWGYMNEILLVTQRKYKTEEALKPVLERTLGLANRMEQVLKEQDATRVSTMAFHGSNSYNTTGLSKITDIVGWNLYQGNTPVLLPVKVYSNLPEVELLVDRKSLGKQKTENCTTVFQVPFSSSKPFLLVKGMYQGSIVQDALEIHFTPIPAQLNITNLKNFELAVNVGSNCFFTSDESQLTWLPDQPYTKGNWGYIGGKEQSTQTEIRNTADGPLYQTLRGDIEGYRFDVPKGVYEVEFLFTDIFQENTGIAYQLNWNSEQKNQENTFNIYANGQLLEEDFSPCLESGYFHALRKRYNITNDRDNIDIHFLSTGGKCFLNGIKLRKIY